MITFVNNGKVETAGTEQRVIEGMNYWVAWVRFGSDAQGAPCCLESPGDNEYDAINNLLQKVQNAAQMIAFNIADTLAPKKERAHKEQVAMLQSKLMDKLGKIPEPKKDN